MKKLITKNQLPAIATEGWNSSCGCGAHERTMIPIFGHGDCNRTFTENGLLIYFEDDHVIYKMSEQDIKDLVADVEREIRARIEAVESGGM